MTGWGWSAPWVLLGLMVLPAVWWLVRVSPPAPRRVVFPSVALLLGLTGPASAARTPPWLLVLRLLAAGLVIVGLAGPQRRGGAVRASVAPVVVVIDNGWAAAPDWGDRVRAATDLLAGMATPAAPGLVLATAAGEQGGAVALGPAGVARDVPQLLAALRPMPWPVDRVGAAAALAALPAATRVVYVADGVAGAGDAVFARALGRLAGATEVRGAAGVVVLRPPVVRADGFDLSGEGLGAGSVTVRALDANGEVLAAVPMDLHGGRGQTGLVLPSEVRNQVTSLRLGEAASAGATVLLDEAARRRPVGLLAVGAGGDQPLVGPLYYVRRALAPVTELRDGSLEGLLARPMAVLVMADGAAADAARLAAWVRGGGMLIRFAGPGLAATGEADALLPAPLLAADRALGGAMSWSQPAGLAPFPVGSPFAGLAVPTEVTVSRQVLAQPGAAPLVWAELADGTPLVTAARLGAGTVVLFHVTANAAWSSLPLSGLFPQMLERLVRRAAGVAAAAPGGLLPPRRVLDGFGVLGPPGPAVRPVPAEMLGTMAVGPAHPPGLYGPAEGARALNLSALLPRLTEAAPIAGAKVRGFSEVDPVRAFGPVLLAAALLLLAIDTLAGLRLRGLLMVLALLAGATAHAAPAMPALATHLAYVLTGDAQADGISAAGLRGLSDDVNARTAAVLAEPVGVDPARDELSFYPLLYWPIVADQPAPQGATLARLDAYMEDGGIIVFDTRDGGADAAAQAALRRIGAALSIPPLVKLTPAHVLTRSFYLLRDWPGRMDGPVWVAAGEDRDNDGVSPVVVGGNDWAAAWAVDQAGDAPYPLQGGEAARVLAFRFGVNLVIYALTGTYKADQLHVPELLRRMGEPP